jgi:hypothetical protein
MHAETYGVSILGIALGLYAVFALLGGAAGV